MIRLFHQTDIIDYPSGRASLVSGENLNRSLLRILRKKNEHAPPKFCNPVEVIVYDSWVIFHIFV